MKKAHQTVVKQKDIKIPSHVSCVLGHDKIEFAGDHLCISKEGDYSTLEVTQNAVSWLVDQLGGVVQWSNNDAK